MALLCYNRGCGNRYDEAQNSDDACLYHPGVPIFHDALKGWSCCKKRTTDFSEFLSIKGCTPGQHSNQKPEEPLRPEVTSDKGNLQHNTGEEIIYQGPKSAEALEKERPSSDEPMSKLPVKVAPSLAQVLENLDISNKEEAKRKLYQGPETNAETCIYHPGVPVFHEGYKYWSCCCIQTTDFNAFLDQKGCTTGKHRWVPKQDKKKVACRHDWHQTGNQVVVTLYAKSANPEQSTIEANRTVVVDVPHSFVSMVPSKVEVTLRKADAVAWGKLEDPRFKPEPQPETLEDSVVETQEAHPDWDIDDDDISESDDEDLLPPVEETAPPKEVPPPK